MRLDQYLVQKSIFRTRSQAKDYISKGSVEIKDRHGDWRVVQKSNFTCSENTEVRLLEGEDSTWVARSGLKLDDALNRLSLDITNLTCLDLGQSTGGFTQSLLKRGALRVVGVDTGHDQLAEDLKNDDRVVYYEGTDARKIGFLKNEYKFDFVAADLSFISILKVLPSILELEMKGSKALVLIKPQFEIGKDALNKSGLVQSAEDQLGCQKMIFNALNKMSIEVLDYFPSSVKGKNGNQEFICYFTFL
jgi:23S rRNA (cytidine1920-2'-O)/16S rRNA (cytidine1409-2'-O)-methyltransferase